jgi:ligand-binding sensor domain-containing protein
MIWKRGLLVCALTMLTAPELAARRLPIQVYTLAQGMPRNSAACLVPDPNGLLWFCTSEGLVRFDGSEFRTFGREQGLPSSAVVNFVISRRGGYWLMTDAGVCRLPPGSRIGDQCRLLSVENLKGGFDPDSLVESPDGRVWVATGLALYRSSADERRLDLATDAPPGDLIAALALGPNGQLLLTTNTAVYLWDGGSLRSLSGPPLPGCGFGAIQSFDPHETWVVGACGVYRVNGWNSAAGPRLTPVRFGRTVLARRVVVRRDRSVWISSSAGLQQWEEQPDGSLVEKEEFGTDDGLPSPWVPFLAEDSQGNLWGATEGLGVFRIVNTGFRVYTGADGLGTARISSIFEDLRGDLCITTSSRIGVPPESHLRVRNGERFERIDFLRDQRFHDWGWGWNQIALQAHNGEWLMTTEKGLYRFAAAALPRDLIGVAPSSVYDRQSPLGEDEIFRIFEDSHGNLWISAIGPHYDFIHWDRTSGVFHHWEAAEGWTPDSSAAVVRESPSGAVWVGTSTSVLRFRNGLFQKVALPDGAIAWARDLYIDRAGRVWLASSRTGLYRCDNPDAAAPVFRRYTTHDGLSSDSTRSITEDNAALIYVGTVRAVDRIDPRAPIGGGNILHLTAADGLPDADQNVAFRDRQGHLWFGTLKGLAEYDPSHIEVHSIPQTYIRRVRVRGEDIPLPWAGTRNFEIHLQSDKNQIEIEYAGIDLRSVASLRYQYRLAGVDAGWSTAAPRFSVNYANLPPGKRAFQVRAVGPDGVPGEGIAALTLTLDAPIWRRAWFLACAGMLFGATVYWLYSYRVGHLIAMERLRTRIATDLHDDIGASLTQISVLSEIGGRDRSRDVLSDVAVISRDIVDEMSDIVWAVSPRHDRFDAIVHRMRRFAEDAMADGELVFDASHLPADLPLPLELRRPLYLVFKEAVNNVARHSQASRMVVRIAARASSIELSIEDNGEGFDPAAHQHGEGLASIRRRVRELSGTVAWDTAPGRGTRFQANLPLRPRGSLTAWRGFRIWLKGLG